MALPLPSILKKSIPQAPVAPLEDPRYTERHRQIALHHAGVLQQRKDAETEILAAIERLLDDSFPSAATITASSPARWDVKELQDLLRPFSTTDYDDLIEERGLAERCGYCLCPKVVAIATNRPKGGIAGLTKAKDDKVRRFCSKDCARRAMYIKVQLSETPSWERLGGHGPKLDIMPEDGALSASSVARKMEQRDDLVSDEQKLKLAMEQLALERGEESSSTRPQAVMQSVVLDRATSTAPPFPSVSSSDEQGDSIEGYRPQFRHGESSTADND